MKLLLKKIKNSNFQSNW